MSLLLCQLRCRLRYRPVNHRESHLQCLVQALLASRLVNPASYHRQYRPASLHNAPQVNRPVDLLECPHLVRQVFLQGLQADNLAGFQLVTPRVFRRRNHHLSHLAFRLYLRLSSLLRCRRRAQAAAPRGLHHQVLQEILLVPLHLYQQPNRLLNRHHILQVSLRVCQPEIRALLPAVHRRLSLALLPVLPRLEFRRQSHHRPRLLLRLLSQV